jgi:predicted transcriptional regulator of viral defense system
MYTFSGKWRARIRLQFGFSMSALFSDRSPTSRLRTIAQLRDAGFGAFFRPSQVEHAGISYHELQQLVAAGQVEHPARGLYRLADVEPTENYSLAAACARVPTAIVCLLSALRVHGIGTQVTRAVWLAIPQRARAPREPGVRIRVVRFSGAAATYGVVKTEFEGVPARITNPTRTVLDCFRFERIVGREAAREALRDAMRQKLVTADSLFRALEVLPSRRLHHVLEATAP